MGQHRARWAAIGAAVAVSIGAGGIITLANAATGTPSTFTPITPCRLLDTRAGLAVGATPPRTTPLGQGEAIVVPARGNFGNCVGLSATATGAALNVTVVNGTLGSFLTVWPSDSLKPLASSLNWVAGQPATPNQVTTAFDAAGQFNVFNNGGTVDVIIDVVGLYEPASASGGIPGPPGPPGAPGADGADGGGSSTFMTAAQPDVAHLSGQFGSMVLDGDGDPVVSHYDETNGDLLLTHCDDPACAPGGDVTNVVDSAGNVGWFTSVALNASGFPVISYYDVTNADLKLVRCDDINCAGGNETITPVDQTGDVGAFTSLALIDGNPTISHYDATNSQLKVAFCSPVCVSNPVDDLSGSLDNGIASSIAGFGGLATIAYYDSDNQDVRVWRCDVSTCVTGTGEIVDNTPGALGQLDMALDASGFPVVTYLDAVADRVAVAHCGDLDCTTAPITSQNLDTATGAVTGSIDPSIALDAAGFPVVSYHDDAPDTMSVARCSDVACVNSTTTVADSDGGQFTSITLGADGFPIISSYDVVPGKLVVTNCIEALCDPARITPAG